MSTVLSGRLSVTERVVLATQDATLEVVVLPLQTAMSWEAIVSRSVAALRDYNGEQVTLRGELQGGVLACATIVSDAVRSGRYHGRIESPAGRALTVELRVDPDLRVFSGDFFRDGVYYCSMRARYVRSDGQLIANNPRFIFDWEEESSVAGMVRLQPRGEQVLELACELPEAVSEQYSGEISYESEYFRTLDIEVDKLDGLPWPPEFSTTTIPAGNQPPSVSDLQVTLAEVFRRAGVDARVSHSNGALAATLAQAAGRPVEQDRWDDRELHELMDASYGRSLSAREWWLYLLIVGRYDGGPAYDTNTGQFFQDQNGNIVNDGIGTLGIIFDHSSGNITDPWKPWADWFAANQPQHLHLFDYGREGSFQNTRARQGVAVFWQEMGDFFGSDSAWHQARTFLRTIVHELGHALNLAHSWLVNRPNTTTFMNYPQRFQPDEAAYWQQFDYSFDPEEIFHFKHAYLNEIVPGGRNEFMKWTQSSVFKDPSAGGTRSNVSLQLRATARLFRLTVPVALEVSVKNHTPTPIPIGSLSPAYDDIRFLIRKPSGTIDTYRPPLRKCEAVRSQIAGCETRKHLTSLAYGAGGFAFDVPGRYEITAVISDPSSGTLVVADPTSIWIDYPDKADEEVARHVFERQSGLFLYFAGGEHLSKGRDAMFEVTDRFPKHPFAAHANLVLGLNLLAGQKHLKTGTVTQSKPSEARPYLERAFAAKSLPTSSQARLAKTIDLCGDTKPPRKPRHEGK